MGMMFPRLQMFNDNGETLADADTQTDDGIAAMPSQLRTFISTIHLQDCVSSS
jgi:hypothetical protein